MRLALIPLLLAPAAAFAQTGAEPPAPRAVEFRGLRADRIWIAPAPGSADLVRLFSDEEAWPRARSLTSVVKFYQQHTLTPPDPIVGPNTYPALVRADAFRTVSDRWGKKIALEVGAVKEFYCTADASGMRSAIDATLASIAAVRAGAGDVNYLAMDEPFVAGVSPTCGGPGLDATADRLAVYMSAVRRAHPGIPIGLIEAYPFFPAERFAGMLFVLRARGVLPDFLHVDVHLRAVKGRRDTLARDMRRFAHYTARHGIPLGIIVWGEPGDTNALYAEDALALAGAFGEAFRQAEQGPDHLIFQSWAESSSGIRATPDNLPETDPHTLTGVLLRGLRELPVGAAVSGARFPVP